MIKAKVNHKQRRWLIVMTVVLLLLVAVILAQPRLSVYAASSSSSGDVAGAVEETWGSAKEQIKRVVNNVIFPVVDMILAILFFVKLGTAYFDYRKHGQFEFTAPCILFACLVFTLTAPLYIWKIIG
jgi:hypothetical protein